MKAGVGYSENSDTAAAGREIAEAALKQAGKSGPCDLVLLFSTAQHDAQTLRDAVTQVLGERALVVGGGAVGAISNDRFGYVGSQAIAAALWLDGATCEFFSEGGLSKDETLAGERLGRQMAQAGVKAGTSVMLFYDAIDRSGEDTRLIMATYLLEGLEKGLGFMPRLVGAGLQGDITGASMPQYTGDDLVEHTALALSFGGDVRMDTVIMHGCRPATGYYTVTKADRQTILEINGQPALPFVMSLMGPNASQDDLPFFLILGVNRGDKWGEFDENVYSNRLCLALDKERNGLVMFEPDMQAGTEFQIMQRSLDLEYIAPNIEGLFAGLGDREPVLAVYIDCAGRAAGYAGMEMDDAGVVQKVVNARVPLLGLYTGVEIAPVLGRPRGLDWTGVFNLFSVSRRK